MAQTVRHMTKYVNRRTPRVRDDIPAGTVVLTATGTSTHRAKSDGRTVCGRFASQPVGISARVTCVTCAGGYLVNTYA